MPVSFATVRMVGSSAERVSRMKMCIRDRDKREFNFERLKNEDPEVRSWADTVLPPGIVRLQLRPAITGPAGYAEYLRTRDALHAAGQPAEDKRRPAEDD